MMAVGRDPTWQPREAARMKSAMVAKLVLPIFDVHSASSGSVFEMEVNLE